MVESNTSLFAQRNIIVGAESLEDRVEEEVMEEVGTAVTAEMEADTIPVLWKATPAIADIMVGAVAVTVVMAGVVLAAMAVAEAAEGVVEEEEEVVVVEAEVVEHQKL
jgi:hypothetical protein